jgi:2,4-dienoyl-CoA reductase-like NADH-dependent reductase (Old Yellow Enzyme family)/thioredoxin reductase
MKLFQPIQIGSMDLKNRIAMAPMATHFADENGAVTPQLRNYYAERARGGVGLVILESGYIHSSARGGHKRLGLHQDSLVAGLKELVDVIHAAGAKVSSQLHHPGRRANMALQGTYPVSASCIPTCVEGIIARALKVQEIEELVEAFGQAAKRSLTAGFDAILIHAGHGYLIHQFLSPCTNRRKDSYGGTFSRRMRFLQEIVHHCRQVVGKDHPIMVRICASEFIPGGITLKDGQKIAQNLEKWGVDAIHVSAGTFETLEMTVPPMAMPRGCLVYLAEGIKKAVNIPVAVVGRIVDPKMAEAILREGRADIITMGRALLADPEFPRKTLEKREEDIRPCIGCLQGCRERLFSGHSITCMVNPAVGGETESKLPIAENPREVLIIGGGPGGLEAARVAASRGHAVTLYERSGHLGGQFYLASLLPHKEEIKNYLKYMIRQIEKLGVKVHLNQEVTAEKISQFRTAFIILATGGSPSGPEIPGVYEGHVLGAWDAILHPEGVGENAVVVGGGGVGAETAELLADLKKNVTLVEMVKEIAKDMEKTNRTLLLRRIGEKGVKIRIRTQVQAIQKDGLEVECSGRREFLPADTVVLATGLRENQELVEPLQRFNVKFYKIGDCVSPRKAIDAIHEGFRIALQI